MALTFKSIGKFIGNAPKKVVKGAGRLVTDPGKAIKNIGKSAGQAWEAIDDVALPVAGFALGGPLGAGAGAGLAEAIGGGRPNWGKVAGKAALGTAAGGAYKALGGMSGIGDKLGALGGGAKSVFGKLGGVAGRGLKAAGGFLGNTAKNMFMSDGGLDFGKLAGLGGAGASLIGQRKDNAKSQQFNDANAKMRQMLMERILQSPNYDFK